MSKSKKDVPEHIKKICQQCPDVDCPFDICYFPNNEKEGASDKK